MILIISCVIYDILTYVTIKQKENKIEREYCKMVKYFFKKKDYNSNNCIEVTPENGDLLYNFCKEKQKCIDTIESEIYLTKFFCDIITNAFSFTYNKIGLLGSICVFFILLLVIILLCFLQSFRIN